MLGRIESAIRLIANGLALFAGVVLLLMMIQTAADVFMANFFGRPIEGNLEIIATYHMVLVVFLPLALVELKHEHISVDLFVRLLPKSVQRAVAVIGYLISAGFLGILTFQTWLDAVNSWRIKEIEMGAIYITVWPAKFALPIGFFVILLALLLHAWKAAFDPGFEPVPADPESVSEPA
jgi:TRAP-type C4-dicarboxylate transport system permease small subunit